MTLNQLTPQALDSFMKSAIGLAKQINQVKANKPVYLPQGKLRKVFNTKISELVVSGGSGTGKTRGILEKIHLACESTPNIRVLIIRKTRVSLTESVLPIFETEVLPFNHPILEGARRENRRSYLYPNGSIIVLGGMDRSTRVLSSQYDIIYVPECIELDQAEWETLRTRRRNNVLHYQQLIGDTNPDAPDHWIMVLEAEGVLQVIRTTHKDNPVYFNLEAGKFTKLGRQYLAGLDQLTGVRKARFRFGKWIQAEGVVYDNFDPQVHVIDRFDIPADWLRFLAIDFGYNNAFVCQWWAVDPDNVMYMYREIYHTKRLVSEHGQQIIQLSRGEKIVTAVCDHDAEDRATLHSLGIETATAKKDVAHGIQKVMDRLTVQPNGKAKLYILRDSLVEVDQELKQAGKPFTTVQEFNSYVWNNKKIKDEPVKLNDHGLDTLRYAVMYADLNSDPAAWVVSPM